MTDEPTVPQHFRPPSSARPLLGTTILVVEDSRYASEAIRLMCLRSGARVRRADCLASARRHLRGYRPSAVIVDLGLPDGRGTELIGELAAARPLAGAILGTSGDPEARACAEAAGADGFLLKPVESIAAFQQAVLAQMPAELRPAGPRRLPAEPVRPDPIAYRDDMAHAAELLAEAPEEGRLAYLAQFLSSVARSGSDGALAEAAESLAHARSNRSLTEASKSLLRRMVSERMALAPAI